MAMDHNQNVYFLEASLISFGDLSVVHWIEKAIKKAKVTAAESGVFVDSTM